MTQPLKPEDDKVRSAKWVVPAAAFAAVIVAVLIATFVINNRNPEMAVNPADQSSSTGLGAGESGQGSVSNNPDAASNPGAAAAPEKAPSNSETK